MRDSSEQNAAREAITVSVILCNYNYGHFVGKAIESVLTQKYSNFELIIVDDGSTDDSAQVIASYEDARIQTVRKENAGQGAAFNTGFELARGEIVSFLDSDDWWKPEKLEVLIRWHRFLNGQYSVLQHRLDVWNNGVVHPYKASLPSGDCFAEMLNLDQVDFFAPTSGISFRRRVLEKVFPIPSNIRICADAYLTRTGFTFGQVISIPDVLGFYREHNNAVYNNRKFEAQSFFSKVLFPEINRFYQKIGVDYRLSRRKNLPPLGIMRRVFRWFYNVFWTLKEGFCGRL